MVETEIIIALGIFLGCLSRAILPFFRKKAEAVEAGKNIRWEGRYTWTIIFAVFVAMISAFLIMPSFQMQDGYVFPMAFAYGWATQDIVNKVA